MALISFTLHFGFNYEINYQLDATEYLFALSSFSLTCFGLTRPSSGAIGVTILTNVAYGVLTRQKPRTPYATFVRIVTPIAPEDGRVSPKHVELKELKANKYSIASSYSSVFIIYQCHFIKNAARGGRGSSPPSNPLAQRNLNLPPHRF